MNVDQNKQIPNNTIGIYLFKNIINNKYYIGQSLNIRKRFNKHINSDETNIMDFI